MGLEMVIRERMEMRHSMEAGKNFLLILLRKGQVFLRGGGGQLLRMLREFLYIGTWVPEKRPRKDIKIVRNR